MSKDKKEKKHKKEKDEKKPKDKKHAIPSLDDHYELVDSHPEKLDKKFYEKEIERLHVELNKLLEWIKFKKLKVVLIFEGRDAAGKGGVIKTISERLNPRSCKIGRASCRERV